MQEIHRVRESKVTKSIRKRTREMEGMRGEPQGAMQRRMFLNLLFV